MTKPYDVVVVTTNRSEYGLLYWLLNALHLAPDFNLKLVVSGTHLSKQYGYTISEIQNASWPIDFQFDYLKDDGDFGDQGASIVKHFYQYLDDCRPDLVVLLGDRYELLSFANAAIMAGVKLGHISGGELTEGMMDDKVRHALTKLSDIHFVGSDSFRKRVIQMGEQPSRVFMVGELGLEHIHHRTNIALFSRAKPCQWEQPDKPFFLVTYHPETSCDKVPIQQQAELLRALASFINDYNILITYPNCDRDGSELINGLHEFALQYQGSVHIEASLGFVRYGQALSEADLMVGNSSSGLYEAPAYQVMTVNVGERQKGRLKGSTVLDCESQQCAIEDTIRSAIHRKKSIQHWDNPYGDGHCTDKVLSILRACLPELTTAKPFYDIDWECLE